MKHGTAFSYRYAMGALIVAAGMWLVPGHASGAAADAAGPKGLLKAAHEAFIDEQVPRDKVIELFRAYLEKEPKSPFEAEIHCMFGYLYTSHRREGEAEDLEKADKSFLDAHKLFGNKFSYDHQTVWATLANRDGASLETRLEYLKWLVFLRDKATEDDIFSVRSIRAYLNDMSAELSKEEKAERLDLFRKKTIGKVQDLARENILKRLTDKKDELEALAAALPKEAVGIEAKRMLTGEAPPVAGEAPVPGTAAAEKEPAPAPPPAAAESREQVPAPEEVGVTIEGPQGAGARIAVIAVLVALLAGIVYVGWKKLGASGRKK